MSPIVFVLVAFVGFASGTKHLPDVPTFVPQVWKDVPDPYSYDSLLLDTLEPYRGKYWDIGPIIGVKTTDYLYFKIKFHSSGKICEVVVLDSYTGLRTPPLESVVEGPICK